MMQVNVRVKAEVVNNIPRIMVDLNEIPSETRRKIFNTTEAILPLSGVGEQLFVIHENLYNAINLRELLGLRDTESLSEYHPSDWEFGTNCDGFRSLLKELMEKNLIEEFMHRVAVAISSALATKIEMIEKLRTGVTIQAFIPNKAEDLPEKNLDIIIQDGIMVTKEGTFKISLTKVSDINEIEHLAKQLGKGFLTPAKIYYETKITEMAMEIERIRREAEQIKREQIIELANVFYKIGSKYPIKVDGEYLIIKTKVIPKYVVYRGHIWNLEFPNTYVDTFEIKLNSTLTEAYAYEGRHVNICPESGKMCLGTLENKKFNAENIEKLIKTMEYQNLTSPFDSNLATLIAEKIVEEELEPVTVVSGVERISNEELWDLLKDKYEL